MFTVWPWVAKLQLSVAGRKHCKDKISNWVPTASSNNIKFKDFYRTFKDHLRHIQGPKCAKNICFKINVCFIMLKIRLNSHITFRSIVRLSWASNTLCFKSVILAWLNYLYHNSRKIPGLSRTSIAFQGLSRQGILFFKFKDFPGFSRTMGTPI